MRRLAQNFRSAEPLLDVLNGTFAAELGPEFAPLVAGAPQRAPEPAADAPLRLFDPDGRAPAAGEPLVELLVTDTRGWDEPDVERSLGLAGGGSQPWRRAEARLVAHRLRGEVEAGRRPGDIVVLVRATGSLRLLEQALEEQGLPTYVVGGRGYWSQEQVRDGIAYLSVLANPQDEEALLAVLASPFCGVGSDALVLLTRAGREGGLGAWAALRDADRDGWLRHLPEAERERLQAFARLLTAERSHAEREPAEALLERAVVATGYDLAVLARSGGDRRLANLRKLMRLARDYERAEGPDLRGLVNYAVTQDLAEAREGEAALESDGLDAVRLMTIHRAKGLEFPVVCVADLGRGAVTVRDRLLVGADGTVGLRLAPIGGGDAIPALAWERLADEARRAEDEEERRLFYVAMTRARERLILSGGVDRERLPAPRQGGPPIDWIWRALGGDVAGPEAVVERAGARLLCRVNAPDTIGTVLPHAALSPAARQRAGAPGTALPDAPAVLPEPPARPRPAPQRLSYSALGAYARCGYRFYLERVLGLPRVPAPPPDEVAPGGDEVLGMDPRVRGSLVHRLLEDLDYARPAAPAAEAVAELAAAWGFEPTAAECEDVRTLVAAFARSPLCARLASARRTRKEAPFSFTLDPAGGGPLVTGFLDVVAHEPDGGALIVDYKSDRLEDSTPADVVERDYATQRIVYALAALRDGAPRAEVAYCFLERPDEPVTATFTDAGALAERLAGLAGDLLAGRFEVTDAPHRELCGDCPGRAAMCSWPRRRPSPQVHRRVELRAEDEHEVRQVEPDEQDHDGGECPVRRRVRGESRDVDEEPLRGEDPRDHPERCARSEVSPAARVEARRGEVDDRVDQHREQERRRPARDVPDADQRVAEPDEAEQVARQLAAEEDEHARQQHEDHEHERPADVLELVRREAPALLDAKDVVERRPHRAERARGGVDRGDEADREGAGGRPAFRLRALQGRRHGVDGLLRRADRLEVVRSLDDQSLLPEHAEHGHADEQRREQREHREVRHRRRPLRHPVLLEAGERAREVAGLEDGPGPPAHGLLGSSA